MVLPAPFKEITEDARYAVTYNGRPHKVTMTELVITNINSRNIYKDRLFKLVDPVGGAVVYMTGDAFDKLVKLTGGYFYRENRGSFDAKAPNVQNIPR